jgi:hypothetical protein
MGQWKEVINYKRAHARTRAHVYLYVCLYIRLSIHLSVSSLYRTGVKSNYQTSYFVQ